MRHGVAVNCTMRACTVLAAALLATALITPLAAADDGGDGDSDPSSLPGVGKCIHINPDPSNPIDIYDCPADTHPRP